MKGVKLPTSAQFQPRPPPSKEFTQQAGEINQRALERRSELFEYGQKLIKMMNDQTLAENKQPTAISVENDVFAKLVELAIESNEDVTEKEGMGSVGLIVLMMKLLFNFRDKVNYSEYKLERLETKVEKLNGLVEKLNSEK